MTNDYHQPNRLSSSILYPEHSTLAYAFDGGAVRVLADEASLLVTECRAVTRLSLLTRADGTAAAAIPHNRDSRRTRRLPRGALAGVRAVRTDLGELKIKKNNNNNSH